MSVYLERVRGWLSEVSYKPGFSFEIRQSSFYYRGDEGLTLLILHDTVDADGVRDKLEVVSHSAVPPVEYLDRKDFLNWLAREVIRREAHETLEWLRYDGQRIFDPHPNGETAYSPSHYLLS